MEMKKVFEPAQNIIYDKTCVNSEDSDQPAHLYSLIRVFAGCMCFLYPLGYRKRDKQESLPYYVDIHVDIHVHADLSLC